MDSIEKEAENEPVCSDFSLNGDFQNLSQLSSIRINERLKFLCKKVGPLLTLRLVFVARGDDIIAS